MDEFDEQAPTITAGLDRLRLYYSEFRIGRQTMGVVDAMEMACLRAGATVRQVEAVYAAVRRAE